MFHLNKPGSLFLVKFVKKHLWKSDILSKDTGHWPASLVKMILTKDADTWHASLLKMSLYQSYFLAYFASENQLFEFFMHGTLGNRLEMD